MINRRIRNFGESLRYETIRKNKRAFESGFDFDIEDFDDDYSDDVGLNFLKICLKIKNCLEQSKKINLTTEELNCLEEIGGKKFFKLGDQKNEELYKSYIDELRFHFPSMGGDPTGFFVNVSPNKLLKSGYKIYCQTEENDYESTPISKIKYIKNIEDIDYAFLKVIETPAFGGSTLGVEWPEFNNENECFISFLD